MGEKICMRYIVSGRVQGVWYRSNTQQKAKSLNLTGWVKNLADGRVELVACGEKEHLNQLNSWLYQGPPLAEVKEVQAEALSFENHIDFQVV